MLRLLLTALLLAVAGAVTAATPADSLRRLLTRPLPDTQRVRVLDELCWQLSRNDIPAARRYGEQGLALARGIGDRLGEARCLNDLGTAAMNEGVLLDATRYYQQAAQVARTLPLGYTPQRVLMFALMGLGNLSTQQRHFAVAEALYQEAQAVRAGLPPGPRALADQALLDLNQSNLYRSWQRYDQALLTSRRALAANRRFNDPTHEALCLRTLGLIHYELQHPDSAVFFWQQSLRIHQAEQDSLGQAGDLENMALALLDAKRWAAAAKMSRQAIALARTVQAREIEAYALEHLAEAQAGLGQGLAAYQTQLRSQHLNDSLNGAAAARELAALQVRYRVAQQQLRIQGLTQRERQARLQAEQQTNRLRLLGLATAGLALALGGFAWFYRRLRRSRAALAASEAALRRSNQTKDQLMSIIGHDLRGPVAAFQQVGPLLRHFAEQPDPQELRALASELHTGAREMGALLDNLLHWARAQTGQVLLRPEALDASSVAEATLALFRPGAAAKDLQLQAELPPAPLWVWADADLLATVLRNLLSNAIKFTPRGGQVKLSVAVQAGQAVFRVEDTGPGLPLGLLDAEHPSSTSGTEGEQGTGLGLSLCRHFVRLLGGELQAEPEGPGARLWFALPLAPASSEPA